MNRFDSATLGLEIEKIPDFSTSSSLDTISRKSSPSLGFVNQSRMALAFLRPTFSQPWLPDNSGDTATLVIHQHILSRRRITMAEARQFALNALQRAEERRARFSEEESFRYRYLAEDV